MDLRARTRALGTLPTPPTRGCLPASTAYPFLSTAHKSERKSDERAITLRRVGTRNRVRFPSVLLARTSRIAFCFCLVSTLFSSFLHGVAQYYSYSHRTLLLAPPADRSLPTPTYAYLPRHRRAG
ncbi:hypothetical protein B0H16DRAFT_1732508 [Mycena metata]|uniref:Transmembrane protein n=1 Tax=Mycena metata TaxID=1033252 RepID=A0AAD7I2J0_9AGAR|nr:hypothetical protein B0H16DRAFT_1732508 [Mycena metata]